jgi:hypothetical protein
MDLEDPLLPAINRAERPGQEQESWDEMLRAELPDDASAETKNPRSSHNGKIS